MNRKRVMTRNGKKIRIDEIYRWRKAGGPAKVREALSKLSLRARKSASAAYYHAHKGSVPAKMSNLFGDDSGDN